MKLKIKQTEKDIKVLLKQVLVNDVYFMYIKNINKTLMISTQINPPSQQGEQYYFEPPDVPPIDLNRPVEIETDIIPNPI
jgi:hypothetical protein